MKKFLVLFSIIALISCESKVSEIESPFNYKKVQDANLSNEINNFITSKLKGSKSDMIKQFDFSKQEILENIEMNQSAIMINGAKSSSQRLLLSKNNNEITDALIMDIIEMSENELIVFQLSDIEGNPILKAEFDYLNKQYNVLEIYNSSKAANWGCNLSLGAAGLLWSTAFGAVTMGAGFVVGATWLVFQTWACQ